MLICTPAKEAAPQGSFNLTAVFKHYLKLQNQRQQNYTFESTGHWFDAGLIPKVCQQQQAFLPILLCLCIHEYGKKGKMH